MKPAAYAETEVKIYVNNLEAVAGRLQAAGAILLTPRVFERNIRYENADESLTARGIIVRLRQDHRNRLTYKEPSKAHEDGLTTRFEAEVEIDDFDTMALILERLGYHPHTTYEKYRTTYTLDGAEIVLDELPYGDFVEIEGQPDNIHRVIDKLGLIMAQRYRDNYLALFDNVRHNLGLPFQHLTFDNFRGINVPPSAFAATREGES
jgi:adenylate cyclase, class 2